MEKKKKSSRGEPYTHEEFDPRQCVIPTIWCGNGNIPKKSRKKVYTHKGTPLQCLRKGFGAGMWSERKLSLPNDSLQNIKYIGDIYEERFVRNGIENVHDLLDFGRSNSPGVIEKTLKRILKRKNGGGVDKRAYNIILVYMYKNGINNLPKCDNLLFFDKNHPDPFFDGDPGPSNGDGIITRGDGNDDSGEKEY